MVYNPAMYMPYQQPIDELRQVTGIEEVRADPMPPSSRRAYWHSTEDVFFIKETDAVGYPTIKTGTFTLAEDTSGNYVTREEYDRLAAMVAKLSEGKDGDCDGEQPVQEQ